MLTQTQENQVSTLLRDGHTFFIAEAGVNHNGDVKLAHRLIDAAADAGADAVKFQGRAFFCGEIRAYVMPLERSIDLDSELDFALAELLLQR